MELEFLGQALVQEFLATELEFPEQEQGQASLEQVLQLSLEQVLVQVSLELALGLRLGM